MSRLQFAVHGDSSLYLKTKSGNKSSMYGDLLHALGVDRTQMYFKANATADIRGVEASIRNGPPCDVMGISLFGNGLTSVAADQSSLDQAIESLCDAVTEISIERVSHRRVCKQVRLRIGL